MTSDSSFHDLITGLVPSADTAPVQVEVKVIDEQGLVPALQAEAASVAALGEGVQLAAERLSRLRRVEHELDEANTRYQEVLLECESLRSELAAAQSLLAQVRDLQQSLQDVLDRD